MPHHNAQAEFVGDPRRHPRDPADVVAFNVHAAGLIASLQELGFQLFQRFLLNIESTCFLTRKKRSPLGFPNSTPSSTYKLCIAISP